MPRSASSLSPYRSREFRLYLLGHGALLLGACVMSETGSMWPMALGAATSLMLLVPLVERLKRGAGARR